MTGPSTPSPRHPNPGTGPPGRDHHRVLSIRSPRTIAVLLGIVLAAGLTGLGANAASGRQAEVQPAVSQITPEAALNRIESDSSVVLIDVRSRAEYLLLGHPTSAFNLPWKRWNDMTGGLDLNADFVEQVRRSLGVDVPILLICRSGHRSTEAARALLKAGFTNVISVRGGMYGNPRGDRGWIASDLPTTMERHAERWLDVR